MATHSSILAWKIPWTEEPCVLLESMGIPREECWSGLPCPPPGDLADPGTEPESLDLLHWQAGSLPLVPPGKSTLFVQDCKD